MVAENQGDALSDDHEVDVRDILHVGPGDLGEDALYVFISSTTGHGDMPDSPNNAPGDVPDTLVDALGDAPDAPGDVPDDATCRAS